MGSRGPVPKRSEERVGKPTQAGGHAAGITKAPAAKRRPVWPAPDPSWDPIAKRWYESLKKSGQNQFYEASDIATAYFVADNVDAYQTGRARGAQMFAALTGAMSTLLSTEADRRRAGIELTTEAPAVDTGKAAIAAYQAMLAKSARPAVAPGPVHDDEAAAA
jgi:hypothetical protein